jgi:hypothetical protein
MFSNQQFQIGNDTKIDNIQCDIMRPWTQIDQTEKVNIENLIKTWEMSISNHFKQRKLTDFIKPTMAHYLTNNKHNIENFKLSLKITETVYMLSSLDRSNET